MNAASYQAGASVLKAHGATRRAIADSAYVAANQIAAFVLLLAFAPLLIIVAVLIARADSRPILFAHYRVGRHGQLFPCFKFRSMYIEADKMLAELLRSDPAAREQWARDQKLADDPRITPIGHFLRKTSLDELPQLFNVLRGEMSLVGPRPITVGELTRYGGDRWHYLCVRPGMTGLWQVSGRNNTTYDERVALDRQYVKEQSMAMDMRILVKTVGVVIKRDGAQ